MKTAAISVELIDSMGSDLSVVNAARVSFDKTSEPVVNFIMRDGVEQKVERLNDSDRKLISYLATHNHWSPFSHAFASFRIKAPIFVARQLVKHTVGLAWNEVSRRYVSSEPEFYLPDTWRKSAVNVKQGSSDEKVEHIDHPDFGISVPLNPLVEEQTRLQLELYTEMLRGGVCAEQARMVLPQNTMTEWIWSGSLYAFARVCNLRLDSHTQRETQDVAKMISNHMNELFPVSWETLVKESSNV
jgi:thymidylate synthase (FAD)